MVIKTKRSKFPTAYTLIVAGAAVGALVAYLFGSGGGRRRRAMIVDKLTHAGHLISDRTSSKAAHFKNKGRGVLATLGGIFRRPESGVNGFVNVENEADVDHELELSGPSRRNS